MKKITLLFTGLFLWNAIGFAQLADKEVTYQKTIIAGKIKKHQPDGQLQQILVYFSRPEESRSEIHRIDVNPDGTFYIALELAFFQQISLQYYNTLEVLVNPGDSIHLHFNGSIRKAEKLLKDVKFSGDNSKINKEWVDFKRNYLTVKLEKNWDAQKEMDFDAYANFRMNYKKELDNNIAKFAHSAKPSNKLLDWLKNDSKWNYIGDILRYPMAQAYHNKIKQSEVNLPNSYQAFLVDMPEIAWKDLSNPAQISYVVSGFRSNIATAAHNNSTNEEEWHAAFSKGMEQAKLPKNGLFYQLMISQRVLTYIKIGDIDIYQKHYEPLVKKYVKAPFLVNKMEKILEEKLYYIKNPLAASDAILKNLKESNEENPFNIILKDHKGKVIYLDFWGTWCKPCIAEFPNSKKLHEDFKEEEVAFVYACIDSKEKVWKAGLAEYQLKGSHYYFNKKQSDEIRKIFEINGIPFYLIIDKEGNIIDKGSHFRPSVKKTRDKLTSLLK